MRLSFVPELARDFDNRQGLLIGMFDELNRSVRETCYGKGLDELVVGFVCMGPYKHQRIDPPQPDYMKNKKVWEQDRKTMTVQNELEYEVELDFHEMRNLEDINFTSYIGRKFHESLNVLDTIIPPIQDFNVVSFKSDVEHILKTRNWL